MKAHTASSSVPRSVLYRRWFFIAMLIAHKYQRHDGADVAALRVERQTSDPQDAGSIPARTMVAQQF